MAHTFPVKKFFPRDVFIVSGARTPIGSFLGAFKTVPAYKLAAVAIGGAVRRAGLAPQQIEQAVVGQALTAGAGQAPHRQAALLAGLSESTDVFAVNKVCASGLKALCMGANCIALQQHDTCVAAGMESMSTAPHLLLNSRQGGARLGHLELKDSLLYDGLWDPYNGMHMGLCTERVVEREQLTRAEQDAYAVESYKRAAHAWKSKVMHREGIEPVTVQDGRDLSQQSVVTEDEEYSRIKLDKVAALKPTFKREGTITAANASKISDGAAAAVLMADEKVFTFDLQPLARIVSFADSAVAPADFAVSPEIAIRKALHCAGLSQADYYEINEAFAAVVLANVKKLDLDLSRVNVHGGAISLGHPLGASGLRIVLSLINVLHTRDGRYGCAAICNGGGGATAIVLEKA